MSTFIHPSAVVETDKIGEGTRIWAGVHIMKGAEIGPDCNIGEGVFIEGDVRLGRGVVVKNEVAIWNRIVIEDHVFIGPSVVFTNDLVPRAHPSYKTGPAGWSSTVVRSGASLGANATIVCGVEIGSWAMVGAGAVVTRAVPAHQLWTGNPAVFRKYVCHCGRALPSELVCVCGHRYHLADDGSLTRLQL